MACRIQNTGKHRLALNLRGGEVLYLDPQQISRPLREEALYDNMFLADWRERGLVRWIDAKMSEVLTAEEPAPPADTHSKDTKSVPAEPDDAAAPAREAATAQAAPKSAAAKKARR